MSIMAKTEASPPSPTTTSRFKSSRRTTEKGRVYDIEISTGEVLPLVSVTTYLQVIAKPDLLGWAVKANKTEAIAVAADLYDEIAYKAPMSKLAFTTSLQARLQHSRADQKQMKRAGDIGKQLHKLVEWTLRKELGEVVDKQPVLCDEGQKAFASWVQWRQEVDLQPIHIEQTVYSLEHGYAGTLDLYAKVNGKLAVLDWKSGKAIYPEAYLQNAAYRCAFEEMGHGAVDCGYIVRLPKTKGDTFEVAKIENGAYLKDLSAFFNVMELWKFLNKFNR